jgi:hypothetical protein
MKNQILLHKFRFPVFKGSVWVIICNNIEKAIDYAEDITSEKIADKKGIKSIRAYAYAYEAESGRRKYILFLKYTAKPGEVAHEVKHLINILFKWHGYNLSLTNDEMECYYLEDIIDKVIEVIKKYKKLNKLD